MVKSNNSDEMTTVEEKLVLDGQVWEPSDAEPLKEEVSQEKPTITQVDADSEATKENGHLNGSNEGIIEEPESDPEPVKPLDNSSMNIEEVFEPTEEAATEEAKPVESSEEDEPLSRLMKTTQPDQTPELVHAVPSSNPYAYIRGRAGLRSGTQSLPCSPIDLGFPPLTRVQGQISLQVDNDRKRPRAESPSKSPNAKRPCRGWPSLLNWWKGDNGSAQPQSAASTLGNENPKICTLM